MCALLSSCATDAPELGAPAAVAAALPETVAATVESDFSIPDITSRTISTEDLATMLPGQPTVTVRSNEQLVIDAVFDRADQADDVVSHGRVTGVSGEYPRDDGVAYVWIDVLADADAAHRYLVDLTGDMAKGVDGTHQPDVGMEPLAEFAVATGEEAVGLIGTLSTGETETLIVTRVGRLVVFASEIRPSDLDTRVAVQYLVEDTLDGVLETLSEDAIDPLVVTPRYRFETTLTVTDAGSTWRTDAIGTIDGSARECELNRTTPHGAVSSALTEIDGIRWVGEGANSRLERTGASATTAQMLVWCPVWPLEVEAAGLSGVELGDDPARHHVNGVDATGYVGDVGDLSFALGIEPAGITIDTFSFWVADGTDWVVELSLMVSGPATSLAPLIGSEFSEVGAVTVSVRHRVQDIGDADPVVAPN
jgi:hypothetical protein